MDTDFVNVYRETFNQLTVTALIPINIYTVD